jgi:PheRS DNA binding domain 1
MEDLEQTVLATLMSQVTIADTWEFSQRTQIDHQALIGILKSLSADNYITEEALSTTFWTLTEVRDRKQI